MRICFYNVTAATRWGGLETYCWEVGRVLAQRGHQVAILAGTGGPARNAEVALHAFAFKARERYPNLGSRFRKLMERLSFARAALPALLEGGWDAVVINKPYDFPALARARRRGLRARTVFRSGGTDFFPGDRAFAWAVDRWAACSAYNARQVEARYGRPVRVIHNGVDCARFHPAARDPALRALWGVPQDAFVVASSGRLVGWKGLHVVVQALPMLPGVHFVIMGDGPERERLCALAHRLGVAAQLHPVGRVAHAELPAALNAADLFVQPSIGEEAFGISVVEAMACGLPVLASDNGGLPEIVTPEVGLLLPPGDVPAWRDAIAGMSLDPQRRAALGQAGRARALDRFTWEGNAEKLLELIGQCARDGSPGARGV